MRAHRDAQIDNFFVSVVSRVKGEHCGPRLDNPSGVRNDLHDVRIAGATGASFYSTDPNLGDTAEVWFVHGGWLYEVTTLKSLDTWLSEIMGTWQFI